MSKKFTIRKLRRLNERTIKILQELDRACFPNDDPFRFKTEGQHWWFAYHRGTVAGFAGIEPYNTTGLPYLCRVGVLPPFRGNGLHGRFIRVRLNYLRKTGFKRAITHTMSGNFSSTNNLIKHGFRQYAHSGTPQPLWWEIKL